MASRGAADASGRLDVHLDSVARASFAEAGVPDDGAPAEARLVRGVAALARRLGSEEAAVAAVQAELPEVEHALERARAAVGGPASSYAEFRAYLSPLARSRVDPFLHGTFALATAYEMAHPAPSWARVTSPFGYRSDPLLATRQLHTGTDYGVGAGTPIEAAAAGTVVISAEDSMNGRFVRIDHGHGLTTAYCHASELAVRKSARVEQGARIMLSGASGRVTGPHLHFQVEIDGTPVDAELFLRGR
jgi:murein DD-endopeptidase MepM/ murein hydrolase activator NlpD